MAYEVIPHIPRTVIQFKHRHYYEDTTVKSFY